MNIDFLCFSLRGVAITKFARGRAGQGRQGNAAFSLLPRPVFIFIFVFVRACVRAFVRSFLFLFCYLWRACVFFCLYSGIPT